MSAPAMKLRPAPIITMAFTFGIGLALLDRLDDAVANARRQRIDRRIVDGDDADAVLDIEPHQRLVALPVSTHGVVSCTAGFRNSGDFPLRQQDLTHERWGQTLPGLNPIGLHKSGKGNMVSDPEGLTPPLPRSLVTAREATAHIVSVMESSQHEAAMTTRINRLNLTDVALVNPSDLGMVMQYMVKSGRGLAMLRGVTEAELREIENALWDELSDDPPQRVATMVRFRCLIAVFRARRLRDLLMHTGYRLIAPAVQVAARMRLNAELGFNPVKFERALSAELDKADVSSRLWPPDVLFVGSATGRRL